MDAAQDLQRIVAELAERYPMYPVSAIEGLVQRTFDSFRDAAVRTYLPVLVKRLAEEQLRYVQEGIPRQAGEPARTH